jgi:hypothetical protein
MSVWFCAVARLTATLKKLFFPTLDEQEIDFESILPIPDRKLG